MSRWRPPSTDKSSPYITAAGYARLKSEYNHLWLERRPEVVRAITAAAAEGDRSENAEYIYRKKELREIDRRVRYLQMRLPLLKVVDQAPSERERIFFGAHIRVFNAQTGSEQYYKIVGGDEAGESPEPHLPQGISVDSPLARALLKKTVGDEVVVTLPAGFQELEVLSVSYEL